MQYTQSEEADQIRPEQERSIQGLAGGGSRGSNAGSQATSSYRCLYAAKIE